MKEAIRVGAVFLAAGLSAALLSSCIGKKEPPPKQGRSELAELAAQAETWASRAETMTQRPWAARLEFPKRLHLRVQALRTFVQEAAGAEPATEARLVERGRALVNRARPFDDALALLERLAGSLDQIAGYARLSEIHMGPLETKGTAPFRIRLEDLGRDAAVGFKHLDEALARILDQSPDADTHQKIAIGTLQRVLETSARLSEEIRQSSALASDAVDRTRLLKGRIDWATGIRSKLGDAVPAEAVKTLDEARAYAEGPLAASNDQVLDKLRNAQPDAVASAEELARRTDAVIERLTGAFLDLGRKAGVPDPR